MSVQSRLSLFLISRILFFIPSPPFWFCGVLVSFPLLGLFIREDFYWHYRISSFPRIIFFPDNKSFGAFNSSQGRLFCCINCRGMGRSGELNSGEIENTVVFSHRCVTIVIRWWSKNHIHYCRLCHIALFELMNFICCRLKDGDLLSPFLFCNLFLQ